MGLYDLTNQQVNQGFGQPSLSTSLASFGSGVLPPKMLDYSFGQQGGVTLPSMGGAQGMQMPGGYGSMPNWGAGAGGANVGGFGFNMPTFALGLQGLNSLGSLVMGAKSLSLANKQFESSEKFANANLANQTHAYNDTLAKRIKRIGSGSGRTQEDMDAEIERRKLPSRV